MGSPPNRGFALLGEPHKHMRSKPLGRPCLGELLRQPEQPRQERKLPVPSIPPILENHSWLPGQAGLVPELQQPPVLPEPSGTGLQEPLGRSTAQTHTSSSRFSGSTLEAPLPTVLGSRGAACPCLWLPSPAPATPMSHPGPGRSTSSVSGPFLPVPHWHLSQPAMATLLLYMASKPIQGTER